MVFVNLSLRCKIRSKRCGRKRAHEALWRSINECQKCIDYGLEQKDQDVCCFIDSVDRAM